MERERERGVRKGRSASEQREREECDWGERDGGE